MRTRAQLLLALLLLMSCTTAVQSVSEPGAGSRQVRSLYDAFARGDVPAVLGSFDPEIVWMEAENINYADRNPYRGPQAVLEGVFMRIGQDWQEFRVNVQEIVDGGDTVVALGRYSAVNKTTKQPLDAQFVHVWACATARSSGFSNTRTRHSLRGSRAPGSSGGASGSCG